MEEQKKGKIKWVLPGVIGFLVLTVIFLNILVLKLDNRVDRLTQGQWHTQPAVAAETHAVGATKVAPDPKQKDPNDDWASLFNADDWNPFAEMQSMQNQIEKMFSDSFDRFGKSPKYSSLMNGADFSPKVDVDEKNNQYILHFDLPGVDKGNVDVHVDGRDVTVSGTRNDVVTQKDDSGKVVHQERRTGTFSRSIELPEAVDATRMHASNEKGVFTIVLPKVSTTKAG